jgi:penicillin-binding protein 2
MEARLFQDCRTAQWYGGDTISLGIGQGYNAFTPLQIAKAIATLANNGVAMRPHLVRAIENGANSTRTAVLPKESSRIELKQENIDFVKQAMAGVTSEQGGTAYAVFHDAQYVSAGKTGTAQVVGMKKNEKYNKSVVAERLRDNSLYTAFAPIDHPRIAIAMVVENGGFGAEAAAPIARKALDYYLLGKRTENANLQSAESDASEPDTAVVMDAEDDAQAAKPAAPATTPAPAPAPTPIPVTTPKAIPTSSAAPGGKK